MIATRKLRELFEVNWLMQRQNPGGTSPCLQGYLLGFAGTIDIRDALDLAETAVLKIKAGNGAVQARPVTFSSAEAAALTPSAAAAALKAAGFEDCEFLVDP
jgi:hypothetical protein